MVPPNPGICSDLSSFLHRRQEVEARGFRASADGSSRRVHTTRYSRGTECYRAPELLKNGAEYNNKVDIWALGCILHELIVGSKPFSDDFHVHQYASTTNTSRRFVVKTGKKWPASDKIKSILNAIISV